MQTFGFDVRVRNLCVIDGIPSTFSSDIDNDGNDDDDDDDDV